MANKRMRAKLKHINEMLWVPEDITKKCHGSVHGLRVALNTLTSINVRTQMRGMKALWRKRMSMITGQALRSQWRSEGAREYFPLSEHGEGSSKENKVYFFSRTGPCWLIQQKRVGRPLRHELYVEFQVVYLESGLKKKGIGQYFPPAGQLSHESKNAFIIDSSYCLGWRVRWFLPTPDFHFWVDDLTQSQCGLKEL